MIIPPLLPFHMDDSFEPYVEPEDVLPGYELALYHDKEGLQEVTAPSYHRVRFRPGANSFPDAREHWGTIQSWKLFRPDGSEFKQAVPAKTICKWDTVHIHHHD